MIRGQKPLKGLKIIPDELSAFKELEFTRVSEYIPKWHDEEEKNQAAEYPPPNNEYNDEVTDDRKQQHMIPNFATNCKTEKIPVQIKAEDETVYDSKEHTQTAADIINE